MSYDFTSVMSAELDRLERELDVRLPAAVRSNLSDAAVHQVFRRYLLDGSPEAWDEAEVIATVASLIGNTTRARQDLEWCDWEDPAVPSWQRTEWPPEKPWPHPFILAGSTGNGDELFIDTAGEAGRIGKWDHETRLLEVIWPTFADFAADHRAEGLELLRTKRPAPPPKPPPSPNAHCPRCGRELRTKRPFLCFMCGQAVRAQS